MATTDLTKDDGQFLNFMSFMSIDSFMKNSILNDANYSNGIMRLNRFVGVMDVKRVRHLFTGDGHNNELEDYGNDFIAWNIFKINCPSFRIGTIDKEIDQIPRHAFKTWQYDDLEVSYIESSDMKVRHYYYEWMESALSSHTFRRRYYDDIMSKWFIIYPLNFQGQAERYEIFEDLIPVDINSVNYDVSDAGDQVALTTVKFKYISHRLLSLTTKHAQEHTSQAKQWNKIPVDLK